MGLVPVADAANFSWASPWIAVLPATDSADARAAVAFGSPPGIAWAPLPTAPFEDVGQGFVIASADVALTGREPQTRRHQGRSCRSSWPPRPRAPYAACEKQRSRPDAAW